MGADFVGILVLILLLNIGSPKGLVDRGQHSNDGPKEAVPNGGKLDGDGLVCKCPSTPNSPVTGEHTSIAPTPKTTALKVASPAIMGTNKPHTNPPSTSTPHSPVAPVSGRIVQRANRDGGRSLKLDRPINFGSNESFAITASTHRPINSPDVPPTTPSGAGGVTLDLKMVALCLGFAILLA